MAKGEDTARTVVGKFPEMRKGFPQSVPGTCLVGCVECRSPTCPDKCPMVILAIDSGIGISQVRLDPAVALDLAALLTEAAERQLADIKRRSN